MTDLTKFPTHSQTFMMPGPAGRLEVMTTWPSSSAPKGVGVICHPDPRQQGAMQNKVVTTIAKAFDKLQLATVRFNFRGVGNSEGYYGDVQGECDDLMAVLTWVNQVTPNTALWLAGFSFGSYISARVAQQINPARLISVAPAVNHHDFKTLTGIQCPWLVIQGDQDEIVPFEQVKAWAEHPPSPLKLIVMHGVTHFFHGRLIELQEIIEKWAVSSQ